MREKTFRKPNAREVLDLSGIQIPERVSEKFIIRLINDGILVPVRSYKDAVEVVEKIDFQEPRFALFSSRFRVPAEDSNYGIKSLESLVKIDSQQVLRDVSGKSEVPASLTKQFAEQYRIWPYTLIKQAMKSADIEKPSIGYYWVGGDNAARATTWLRCTTGAEMEMMKKRGDFSGEIVDEKFYGRSLRVRVDSRMGIEVDEYPFTLSRLPIHKAGDLRQYSEWINIGHNSPDPDASYRGLAHEKRKNPLVFWSATPVFAFYEAMLFVEKHPEAKRFGKKFRINPFAIPGNEKMIDFIDKLRLRSLIFHEYEGKKERGLRLDVLNKTEIDRVLGARTIERGYDNCWFHWGKRDLSYLYKS